MAYGLYPKDSLKSKDANCIRVRCHYMGDMPIKRCGFNAFRRMFLLVESSMFKLTITSSLILVRGDGLENTEEGSGTSYQA